MKPMAGDTPGGGKLSVLDNAPILSSLHPARAIVANAVQARQVHNADFSTSPNTTIPGTSDSAPAAPAQKRSKERKHHHHSDNKHANNKAVMGKQNAETASTLDRVVEGGPITGGPAKLTRVPGQRRAEGHKHESKHGSKHENEHESKPASKQKSQQHSTGDAPSGPAGLTSGLASGVKEVGGAPKQLSQITSGLPPVPDTPATTADVPAEAGSGAGQVPVPRPAPEKEVPAESGAYPTEVAYTYAAPKPSVATANANQKRHDITLDTDTLMGTDDKTKDPKVGMVNVDSNRKPEDTKEDAPKKGNVALAGTDTATAPTATATHSSATLAEPTPTYKEVA